MNEYIATFYTHYGAMLFFKECKKLSIESKQMPVPRKLSSSCGTCVWFKSDTCAFVKNIDVEDELEGCYQVIGDGYKKVGY